MINCYRAVLFMLNNCLLLYICFEPKALKSSHTVIVVHMTFSIVSKCKLNDFFAITVFFFLSERNTFNFILGVTSDYCQNSSGLFYLFGAQLYVVSGTFQSLCIYVFLYLSVFVLIVFLCY